MQQRGRVREVLSWDLQSVRRLEITVRWTTIGMATETTPYDK